MEKCASEGTANMVELMIEDTVKRPNPSGAASVEAPLEIDLVLASECDIAFCLRLSQLRTAAQRCCLIFINSENLAWQQASIFEKAVDVAVVNGDQPVLLTTHTIYFIPMTYSVKRIGSRWQLSPDASGIATLKALLEGGRLQVQDLVLLRTAHLKREAVDWYKGVERVWVEGDLESREAVLEHVHSISRSELMASLCDQALTVQGKKSDAEIERSKRYQDQQRVYLKQHHNHRFDLIKALSEESGVAYKEYSEAWVIGRCHERVEALGLNSIEAYSDYCANNDYEVEQLEQVLFTAQPDPEWCKEVFLEAQQLLKRFPLAQNCQDKPFRVWVPSGGLGEAAYAFALAWQQMLNHNQTRGLLKVFSTHMGKGFKKQASIGLHTQCVSALKQCGVEIEAFIHEHRDAFYTMPALRHNIAFSKHDLRRSPPYRGVHLIISKQSLTPYIESVREKIVMIFNQSLVEGGLLWLGLEDERHVAGQISTYGFEAVEGFRALYRKVDELTETSLHTMDHIDSLPRSHYAPPLPLLLKHHKRFNRYTDYQRILDHLIDEFLLPGVLFDDRFQLLHVMGDVAPFMFEPKKQNFIFDIRYLFKPPLSVHLPMLVEQLFEQKTRRLYRTEWYDEKEQHVGALNVHLLYELDQSKSRGIGVLLFELQLQESVADAKANDSIKSQFEYIHRLESDLLKAQKDASRVLQVQQEKLDEANVTQAKLAYDNDQLQKINQHISSRYETLTVMHQKVHYDQFCLAQAFDLLPMAVAILTKEGRFRFVNPRFREYLCQHKLFVKEGDIQDLGITLFKHDCLGNAYDALVSILSASEMDEMDKMDAEAISVPLPSNLTLYFTSLPMHEVLVALSSTPI